MHWPRVMAVRQTTPPLWISDRLCVWCLVGVFNEGDLFPDGLLLGWGYRMEGRANASRRLQREGQGRSHNGMVESGIKSI